MVFGPVKIGDAGQENRLLAAMERIDALGFRQSGNPIYSYRQAATDFTVPKSTLTARHKHHRKTRKKAHEFRQHLTAAMEDQLVETIKIQGHRGLTLDKEDIKLYAEAICGYPVGDTWYDHFRKRHLDELKTRWTRNFEASRARSLNETNTSSFFSLLEETVKEFQIDDDDIYNMDEKGIQLGITGRVQTLVDRNQQSVNRVEDGNRELVTIIETVCADGTALRPCVVFKGTRRNLEWGRDNPGGASISHSPKGWTDSELGRKWIERDFDPESKARQKTRGKSEGYRLLILDGHNSHCTYSFCDYAQKNKIILICLPPHTTHALQPCDVGVFGPLASTWKAQVGSVMKASLQGITKNNLLRNYHIARKEAMKVTTIKSTFRKTGIVPFNADILPKEAFAPAKLTTTAAAQIVSMGVPPLLEITAEYPAYHRTPSPSRSQSPTSTEPLFFPPSSPSRASISPSPSRVRSDSSCSSDSDEDRRHDADLFALPRGASDPLQLENGETVETVVEYRVIGLPARPGGNATKELLAQTVAELFDIVDQAKYQIERDIAAKKLMEVENQRLRRVIFGRRDSKKARAEVSGKARHMTAEENIQALAEYDWAFKMRSVYAEMKVEVKRRDKKAKEAEAKKKEAEKEQERQQKEVERVQKEAEKQAEKERKEEERRLKAIEKEHDRLRKEEEKQRKEEEKEEAKRVEKERKSEEKLQKAAEKLREKERKAEEKRIESEAKAAAGPAKRGRKRKTLTDDAAHPELPASKQRRLEHPLPPSQTLPAPRAPHASQTTHDSTWEPPEVGSREWRQEMVIDPALQSLGESSARFD